MSQSTQDKKKLFDFKWGASHRPNSFKFDLRSNSAPVNLVAANTSHKSWTSESNQTPFKNNFNIKNISNQNSFKFTLHTNKESNTKNTTQMMFSPLKPKRNIKMPQFAMLKTYNSTINDLELQINELQSKLNKLKHEQSEAKVSKTKVETEVNDWYKKWKLWNVEDFIQWVFEEIDDGYFKTKRLNAFDVNKFTLCLNETVKRFSTMAEWNSTVNIYEFEGKHLKYLDILDVKQLFGFLNSEDCRKLFTEIEKLTKGERYKNKIDECCEICTVDKKQYVLGCGHIFCARCVFKLKVCAFCKKKIEKKKIIKVYL